MRAAFNDKPETLTAFREQVRGQLGRQVEVVEETSERRRISAEGGTREIRLFHRFARFEKSPQVFHVHWAFDDAGRVVAFSIRPRYVEAQSAYLEYRTKTDLRLPFDEEWTVYWGGRAVAQNYHAATVDQRFAYDILILKDGSSFAGDPRRNESYHCFGRRVLAPGAGVVVATANDVEDNVPGKMNPRQAMGNHVILDHENGEFSFLAHFKHGSVAVAKGDRVQAGGFLGLAGNSGNSSEAHLHYHLQTTPEFLKGEGLPAQFQGYLADGKAVERGEPVKGQRVRPAPAADGGGGG
jgi:hypothetical protein